MLKKKTERLIPQSDQPKKQVSRGKVTVPKNSKQNALSTEKNSLENRKTAKNQLPARKIPPVRKNQIRKKQKIKIQKHSKNPFRKTVLQGL